MRLKIYEGSSADMQKMVLQIRACWLPLRLAVWVAPVGEHKRTMSLGLNRAGPFITRESSPTFLIVAFSGGVPEDESISDILKRNKIVEATMADVMALEQALAAVTEEPVDAYKLRRHTVGEMRRRFPFMDWEKFFSGAFDGVAGEGADRRIKVRSGYFP